MFAYCSFVHGVSVIISYIVIAVSSYNNTTVGILPFTCDNGCTISGYGYNDSYCDCENCEDEPNWNCTSCSVGCPAWNNASCTSDNTNYPCNYNTPVNFTCDDGCSIPLSWENDDYCDCQDCEDEMTTGWNCTTCNWGCPIHWNTSCNLIISGDYYSCDTPYFNTSANYTTTGYDIFICDNGCGIISDWENDHYCDCENCEDETTTGWDCQSCFWGCPVYNDTNCELIAGYIQPCYDSGGLSTTDVNIAIVTTETEDKIDIWSDYDGDCNWYFDENFEMPLIEGECHLIDYGISALVECYATGTAIVSYYNESNCDGDLFDYYYPEIYHCDRQTDNSDCDAIIFTAIAFDKNNNNNNNDDDDVSETCTGDGELYQKLQIASGFEDGVCINYFGENGIRIKINENDGYSLIEYRKTDCSNRRQLDNSTIRDNVCVEYDDYYVLYQFEAEDDALRCANYALTTIVTIFATVLAC